MDCTAPGTCCARPGCLSGTLPLRRIGRRYIEKKKKKGKKGKKKAGPRSTVQAEGGPSAFGHLPIAGVHQGKEGRKKKGKAALFGILVALAGARPPSVLGQCREKRRKRRKGTRTRGPAARSGLQHRRQAVGDISREEKMSAPAPATILLPSSSPGKGRRKGEKKKETDFHGCSDS